MMRCKFRLKNVSLMHKKFSYFDYTPNLRCRYTCSHLHVKEPFYDYHDEIIPLSVMKMNTRQTMYIINRSNNGNNNNVCWYAVL